MPGKVKQDYRLEKNEYEKKIPGMRNELGALHRAINKSAIPVIIVFEGVEASGRHIMVNELLRAMDPRYFQVYAIGEPTEDEASRPFLWRFWKKIPPGGRIHIFESSWYARLIAEKAGKDVDKSGRPLRKEEEITSEIVAFERQLATDEGNEVAKRYLIIKIYLAIGKNEQKKRLTEMQGDNATLFLFDRPDWKAYKHYDDDCKAFDRMIKRTDAEYARWHIIDTNDLRLATVKVYEAVIDSFRKRLEEPEDNGVADKRTRAPQARKEEKCPVLSQVDLSQAMPEHEYHARLKACQQELARLQFKVYRKNVPVVIVFEGMDAAGKGGSIKRLSESFDPRGYDVVPIGVPNEWEKAHHYFWRFWIHFPPEGFITIFDRSWYGRVLVERVEKLTPEKSWRQAYDEINQTEEALLDNGTAIAKFWLHISPEVQYERLKAREDDPAKNWKVDPHDWKKHSHWDNYMAAAEEMICRTSTSRAPWTIVPSNDKRYSRITVMETVIETIKKAL
jgi:polyphosphate:AMP phosphotransferase